MNPLTPPHPHHMVHHSADQVTWSKSDFSAKEKRLMVRTWAPLTETLCTTLIYTPWSSTGLLQFHADILFQKTRSFLSCGGYSKKSKNFRQYGYNVDMGDICKYCGFFGCVTIHESHFSPQYLHRFLRGFSFLNRGTVNFDNL